MITDWVQRYLPFTRRSVYRPAREVVRSADVDVERSADQTGLKAFVAAHHYAERCASIVRGFKVHWRGRFAGVALFSVCARQYRPPFGEVGAWLTLGRFCLLDEVGGNAETLVIAEAFRELRREGFEGVVSFSDPHRRVALDGRVILPGHVGTIYQAHNGVYTGRSKSETKQLLPDGTLFEGRAAQKVRTGDQGHAYARRILEANGAEPLRPGEDAGAWVARWRAELCRPFLHRGNHRYLWALDKRARRHLPASLPYPKMGKPS